LRSEVNVLRSGARGQSEEADVPRLVLCVPRNAPQPMTEDLLLTGALEPTNEWYAVAKIAGLKLAEAYRRQFGADFISVMPTNLYGPGDNYHPENSHVPAALIRRFHEAKVKGADEVVVWGTGKPKREFLAADDLGDACVFVMKHYSGDGFLNVGTGQEVSIGDFARLVAEIVGYRGKLAFGYKPSRWPPRKLLDISKSVCWAGPPKRRCGTACRPPTRIFWPAAPACANGKTSALGSRRSIAL
jgi:GDP-L-fucose synthase